MSLDKRRESGTMIVITGSIHGEEVDPRVSLWLYLVSTCAGFCLDLSFICNQQCSKTLKVQQWCRIKSDSSNCVWSFPTPRLPKWFLCRYYQFLLELDFVFFQISTNKPVKFSERTMSREKVSRYTINVLLILHRPWSRYKHTTESDQSTFRLPSSW